MPNLKYLEILGLSLSEWMKLTDEQKAEATKKAEQVISDSHPSVTITYGDKSISRRSTISDHTKRNEGGTS
jgi:hypothetical protein